MRKSNTVRIIWLSDIHFNGDYDKNPPSWLKTYLDKFVDIIGKQRGDEAIDYVLISGDLAFKGVAADYEAFNSNIIKPLKGLLPEAQFLTIPGNHDVNWKESKFLDDFIGSLNNEKLEVLKKQVSRMRAIFLKKKEGNFNVMFRTYTEHFWDAIKPTLESITCDTYKARGLFGVVVNKEKNFVLNLCNSAWFALGGQFDTMLLEAFMEREYGNVRDLLDHRSPHGSDKKREADFRKKLERLALVKTVLQEYGEQILGEDIVGKKKILEELDNHAGDLTLTCFHHPTNWLQYELRYGNDKESYNEKFLNQILEKSDILLTGHEHVPSSVMHETIGNGTVHLKGGMFLRDNCYKVSPVEHRFSILTIDTSRFTLEEEKFVYDFRKSKWREPSRDEVKPIRIRRRPFKYDEKKELGWKKKLLAPRTIQNFLSYRMMTGEQWKDGRLVKDDRYRATDHVLLQFKRQGVVERLYILPTDTDFFDFTLPAKPDPGHFLDVVFKRVRRATNPFPKPLTVTIVTPDYLVDRELRNYYIGAMRPDEKAKTEDKSDAVEKEIYNSIVSKADQLLSTAKSNFLVRFERQLERNIELNAADLELEVNGLRFAAVRETRFSVQVIPFWAIDRYI
jgi:hypothetical protein